MSDIMSPQIVKPEYILFVSVIKRITKIGQNIEAEKITCPEPNFIFV